MWAIGRRKGIRIPLDERRVGQYHTDDIEAHAIPIDRRPPGVITAGAAEVVLLFCIDGAIGSTELGSGSRFHFDED